MIAQQIELLKSDRQNMKNKIRELEKFRILQSERVSIGIEIPHTICTHQNNSHVFCMTCVDDREDEFSKMSIVYCVYVNGYCTHGLDGSIKCCSTCIHELSLQLDIDYDIVLRKLGTVMNLHRLFVANIRQDHRDKLVSIDTYMSSVDLQIGILNSTIDDGDTTGSDLDYSDTSYHTEDTITEYDSDDSDDTDDTDDSGEKCVSRKN